MSLFLGQVCMGAHGGCTLAAVQARYPGSHVVSCLPGGVFDPAPKIVDHPEQTLTVGQDYAVVESGACMWPLVNVFYIKHDCPCSWEAPFLSRVIADPVAQAEVTAVVVGDRPLEIFQVCCPPVVTLGCCCRPALRASGPEPHCPCENGGDTCHGGRVGEQLRARVWHFHRLRRACHPAHWAGPSRAVTDWAHSLARVRLGGFSTLV